MRGRLVLLISKRVALERYRATDLDRLSAAGQDRRPMLAAAQEAHQQSLTAVRAALHGAELVEATLDRIKAADAARADLAVCVGGDGTVLATHGLLASTPLLAVNSDPHRSVGHYTRCSAEQVPAVLASWQADRTLIEALARLELINEHGAATPVLNDVLLTNHNPSAMSRYLLEVEDLQEEQSSSGLWISTASGSTGAIASAGLTVRPDCAGQMLWLVREPCIARGPCTLREGCQKSARGLRLMPLIPGLHSYLDGGQRGSAPIPCGAWVTIQPHAHPLRLLINPE